MRARALADAHRAVRLCPDEWMTDLGVDLYDEPFRARSEERLTGPAGEVLAAGGAVVVEFGSWSRAERDALPALGRRTGVPVLADADFGHTNPPATLPIGGGVTVSAGPASTTTITRHRPPGLGARPGPASWLPPAAVPFPTTYEGVRVQFAITQAVRADGLDVVVVGELDIDSAPEFRSRLLAAVRTYDLVLLDLSGVSFIDSQGLGVLIRVNAEAGARGAALRLVRASYRVRQLLELTNLTSLFPVGPDPDGR